MPDVHERLRMCLQSLHDECTDATVELDELMPVEHRYNRDALRDIRYALDRIMSRIERTAPDIDPE